MPYCILSCHSPSPSLWKSRPHTLTQCTIYVQNISKWPRCAACPLFFGPPSSQLSSLSAAQRSFLNCARKSPELEVARRSPGRKSSNCMWLVVSNKHATIQKYVEKIGKVYESYEPFMNMSLLNMYEHVPSVLDVCVQLNSNASSWWLFDRLCKYFTLLYHLADLVDSNNESDHVRSINKPSPKRRVGRTPLQNFFECTRKCKRYPPVGSSILCILRTNIPAKFWQSVLIFSCLKRRSSNLLDWISSPIKVIVGDDAVSINPETNLAPLAEISWTLFYTNHFFDSNVMPYATNVPHIYE